MKTISIKTSNPLLADAYSLILEANGYKHGDTSYCQHPFPKQYGGEFINCFKNGDGYRGYSGHPAAAGKTLDGSDDFRSIIKWIAEPIVAPIVVNGHTVEFQKDSIKVGCTTVSKETVLEIAKRIQEAA